MKAQMNYNLDDWLGAISGMVGAIMTGWVLGITWHSAWEDFINLVWLGVGAMFTGGMGMLGKKLAERFWEKRKNKKSK
jgi:hypothetical protein